MARSLNDFVNRRNRPTLTHGARYRVALVSEEFDSPQGSIFAKIALALLIVSMMLRLIGVAMMSQALHGQAFHNVDDTEAMIDSLGQVTASLAAAGEWLIAANGLTIAGGVLILLALVQYRYRAVWVMRAFFALALVHLPFPLIGTAFGIACLAFLFWHRREFSPPKSVIPISS